MDQSQNIQAEQYVFPYHYLPVFEENTTRLTRQWNWAPNYIAALRLTADWLRRLRISPDRDWKHIDIGCGDGALIFHLSQMFKKNRKMSWVGIDYDDRAIEWARIFNGENTEFVAGDIRRDYPAGSCDSASLIEVAEHIPPQHLSAFIDAIHRVLKPGAQLFVTVPHSNRPVQKKHFQHFDFAHLETCFSSHFEVVEISGFAKHTRLSKLVQRIIMNRRYVFTLEPLSNRVINQLQRTYDETENVGRIVAVFRKRG
ncbi:MAG: class I SAM-dependent methyltransferase [Pseudomonadota bacterium]